MKWGIFMKRRKYWVCSSIMTAAFMAAMTMSSLAGTISSVKISVSSEIQPGDTLPEISIDDGSSSSAKEGELVVSTSSDRYHISEAKWTTSTSRTMDVGDTPELRVWLTPTNNSSSDDNYFKGTYRSSNVSVRGGTFVSASRSGEDLVVKLRVKAIEGNFAPPEDAYWRDNAKGTARWTKPDSGGTGRYEVVLRRGSTKVHSIETTSTSYNFYPYMTSAGTYTFRVRTIPKTSKEEDYGKKSEWIESDELYIAREDVSDGSGRTDNNGSSGPNGNTRVGWQHIDGYWYYYYPDGNYHKNGWLYVGDKWYLFQSDGKMLKGWQMVGGNYFFLNESGDMLTGWLKSGNRWYFLNTTPDSNYGVMLRNSWVVLGDKAYYMTSDGSMAEGWYQVDGNWYYFYPGQGHKAVNTYIDTFYVDANGVWQH